MLRKGGGSFAFFITSPRVKAAPVAVETQMFVFPEGAREPYFPEVTLFGSMTIDECKMLALLIYTRNRVKMRVPDDFEHQRFHGDAVTLSFDRLMRELEAFVGNPERLPPGAVVSMSAFFDYIREKLISRPATPKNPATVY